MFVYNNYMSIFKMAAPKNGMVVDSADLGMTKPTEANTKETTGQKTEKVSV